MKKSFKILAFLLAMASFLLCLAGCQENAGEENPSSKDNSPEMISEQALSYVNRAMEYYKSASCYSETLSYASVFEKGAAKPSMGYAQYYKTLIDHKNDSISQMSDIYFKYTTEPEKVSADTAEKFSTCYVKDGIVYHSYLSEKEEPFAVHWEYDDFSHMGLFSISNTTPGSFYAVKYSDSVRVSLTYLNGKNDIAQNAFINQMLAALAPSSEMTFLLNVDVIDFDAYIDPETGAFEHYSISFYATSPLFSEGTKIYFHYEERFYDYNTNDKITFPEDLQSYPVLK